MEDPEIPLKLTESQRNDLLHCLERYETFSEVLGRKSGQIGFAHAVRRRTQTYRETLALGSFAWPVFGDLLKDMAHLRTMTDGMFTGKGLPFLMRMQRKLGLMFVSIDGLDELIAREERVLAFLVRAATAAGSPSLDLRGIPDEVIAKIMVQKRE